MFIGLPEQPQLLWLAVWRVSAECVPDADGLTVSPAIPSEWDGFRIEKSFRGKQLSIEVQNAEHVQSGVREIVLNGEKLEGNYIPADKLATENKITVIMG